LIGWHHDLVADDAGQIGAAFFGYSRRQLLANAAIAKHVEIIVTPPTG